MLYTLFYPLPHQLTSQICNLLLLLIEITGLRNESWYKLLHLCFNLKLKECILLPIFTIRKQLVINLINFLFSQPPFVIEYLFFCKSVEHFLEFYLFLGFFNVYVRSVHWIPSSRFIQFHGNSSTALQQWSWPGLFWFFGLFIKLFPITLNPIMQFGHYHHVVSIRIHILHFG